MDEFLVAVRAVVALAAVLGLLLWIGRRVQKGQSPGASAAPGPLAKRLGGLFAMRPAVGARRPAERITVVARSSLGGRAQLVVAEFDGIRYVLGVSEHGVNVVDTQEAPIEEECAPAASPTGRGDAPAGTADPVTLTSAGRGQEHTVAIFPDRVTSRRQVRQRAGYRTPPLSR